MSKNITAHEICVVHALYDPNRDPGTTDRNNSQNRPQGGKALDILLVTAKGSLQLPRPLSETPHRVLVHIVGRTAPGKETIPVLVNTILNQSS